MPDLEDVFIHEAAHALVYDVIDQPMEFIRAELLPDGKSQGKTERGQDVVVSQSLAVLEFMAGAAALMYLAKLPFESIINKVRTDFRTLIPQLPCATAREAMLWMARLKCFAQSGGKEWVRSVEQPIIHLAVLLKDNPTDTNTWELRGQNLTKALQRAWGRTKPVKHETLDFAEREWAAIKRLPDSELQIEQPWQFDYLESLLGLGSTFKDICSTGCSTAGYPQLMKEQGAGGYVCPQCSHEVRPLQPDFLCTCSRCSRSAFI